ncbi:MAG: IS200/IS605 family transposase [bacterium]
MPFARILIHVVWATKDRKKYLTKAKKETLIIHINQYALSKGITLLNINGYLDHLHCIISLKPEQCISNILNLLKGESSYWANRNLKMMEKFGWHDDYFAVSFSHSQLKIVNNYINRQELLHQSKTFQQEYEEFLLKFGFDV